MPLTSEQMTKLQSQLASVHGAYEHGDCAARSIIDAALHITLLLLRKNKDYGPAVFRPPRLAPGISAEDALSVRISDKIARIENLRTKGDAPSVAESLTDSEDDLCGYLILKRAVREIPN